MRDPRISITMPHSDLKWLLQLVSREGATHPMRCDRPGTPRYRRVRDVLLRAALGPAADVLEQPQAWEHAL